MADTTAFAKLLGAEEMDSSEAIEIGVGFKKDWKERNFLVRDTAGRCISSYVSMGGYVFFMWYKICMKYALRKIKICFEQK